jgi:hypothetical protein
MKKLLFSLWMLSVCAMMLPSCKGDDGAIGPAGANGANGSTGPAGPAGATGTANVIYSAWTMVTFTGSSTSWSATLTAPGITQAILDQGAVLVYLKTGTQVYPMNYSGSGGFINYYVTVGQIVFAASFNGTYQYRYVIIPGGVSGSRVANGSSAFTLEELKAMPYERVKALYNIQD